MVLLGMRPWGSASPPPPLCGGGGGGGCSGSSWMPSPSGTGSGSSGRLKRAGEQG